MLGCKKTEREKKLARIAALNDRLRETFWGGQALLGLGLCAVLLGSA